MDRRWQVSSPVLELFLGDGGLKSQSFLSVSLVGGAASLIRAWFISKALLSVTIVTCFPSDSSMVAMAMAPACCPDAVLGALGKQQGGVRLVASQSQACNSSKVIHWFLPLANPVVVRILESSCLINDLNSAGLRECVISLLSNIVVLLMFVKFKELRTATNFIIINLALTDIGVAGIGYPMSAASDIHGSWKFGYVGCQIYAALNIFFGMASIGLLTVVAIDRYLTICRPDLGQKMTMRSYNLLILAAWLNAVFWSTMPVVGWAGYAPDPTGATCTINWRNNDASFISYTMAVIAVNFVLPLSAMFYCYYNVSVTVKRYKANNCLDSVNIDWSDQINVTKMSMVMIVMFLVAWSPYSMVCLWASFGDPKTIPTAMAIIAPLFAKSSTFYNPCIYVIANKNSRTLLYEMPSNTEVISAGVVTFTMIG
ncbi:Visual pigment-like receptor peropsin [Liparis tanakae]|uniref:Visual pigment-like receptor peropsin n=1 Tax=Liparis tanakae TaxID=230148 RepID=A0A4Z2HAT9_9TELE|nr:Visual pigment-like receptor peropsin [Liparis tanakae]